MNYVLWLPALLAAGLLLQTDLRAQVPPHPVYLDTTVATIRILIDPDSLAQILDPANAQSDHEFPATFFFENPIISDTVENIGFRLRGNTSRVSQKKSFKVSINSFERGRKFSGLEKLNINGEHNDPSIIRAKLSWDLFAKAGVPASRASHTQLYINGLYYGLYISVEHVDENFVQTRFGNNNGNLYKCLWPADLRYLGSDPNLYKLMSGNRRVYELTINEEMDDYTDLAHFISVVNLTPTDSLAVAIQRVFNVNSFLKTLAMDVAVGSWDDYWFLKNNYYLYHNLNTGKFEFIPYDYDNTFGIWWTSIMPNIDFGTRNVYSWGHPSEQRPLASRILGVPAFKNRFSFYLNRLIQRHFHEPAMYPRIDSIHTMITPAAEADSFRTLDYGFTIQQFHNSYSQALGNHVTYGLKPYISTRRSSALGQLQNVNVPPILSDLVHSPRTPFAGDPVTVNVRVEDEAAAQSVLMFYTVDGSPQSPATLYDDGLHNDGAAGDEVYGAILAGLPADALIEYYVRAVDVTAQIAYEPPDAPATTQRFRVLGAKPRLFINEFMAANTGSVRDPFNEADDWIEIYNGDSVAVAISNCYLSDNFNNPMKWRFPDTTIAPGAFMLVWADDQPHQGPLHATFKLDRDGERVGLFRGDSSALAILDTISFGYQQSDVSYGRMPDGGAWQAMAQPTPGYSNVPTSVTGDALPEEFTLYQPYPNPFNPTTEIRYQTSEVSHVTLRVFDILGRGVATLLNGRLDAGRHRIIWNASGFASGVYFIRMQSGRFVKTAKVLLMR
ncbi:MAG: CotH kinase family protein [Bacteroidetes bacterium]|nr:CotH kinase family protein [Bacteroidota bacterium]MCW5894526.1 CotH kinase family protein [Bacteroidota bacterium]